MRDQKTDTDKESKASEEKVSEDVEEYLDN